MPPTVPPARAHVPLGLFGIGLLVGMLSGVAIGSSGGASRRAGVPACGDQWAPEPSGVASAPGNDDPPATGPSRAVADEPPPPLGLENGEPAGGAVRTSATEGGRIDWIALGGGVDPMSNQISIEQDLRLAQAVLGARRPGMLLYGAGRSGTLVQVRDERPLTDELTAELAALFDPRPDRSVRYRPSVLRADEASARAPFFAGLAAAAARGASREPLLVYVAAHGEAGEQPRDNSIAFWGGDPLRVHELASALDEQPRARPLLLVASSCFSGGFAELVFAGAEPGRGAPESLRCGLFASTWDREAEGCDPNPDRRVQESYGVHFLNALHHADRQGRPLPLRALDLDGDGRVSASEAHARVRVASRSISVPTSSSERWLRQVAPDGGPEQPMATPEEDVVVDSLATALGTVDRPSALERHRVLELSAERLDAALAQTEKQQDDRWQSLVLLLLERWPVLDDPWHPDFAATLAADRESIGTALHSTPVAVAYRAGEAEAERIARAVGALEVELALVERQIRAFDNRSLAARLHARGGADFERYRMLLECERSWPPGP